MSGLWSAAIATVVALVDPTEPETRAAPAAIVLEWDAPASCPSAEEIHARSLALLGGPPRGAGTMYARGAVARHGGVWTLHLTTTFEGASDERILRAARCETLGDATATVFAIALEPGRKLATLYSRIRIVRRRFETFMRERDEHGAAALEQARDGRPRAHVAGWAAIVPRLGWTGGASGLASHVGSYVVGGVVALSALWGARMVVGDPATPSAHHVVAGLARAPASSATRGPVVEGPTQEADAPTVVAEVEARETPSLPPRASQARSRRPPTLVASTDLAADLQLLRTAGDSLHERDAARALTQLETHAERFAASPQADLRAALRVEALCMLGRVADATKTANTLLTARPTTPVATRIRSSCIMKTME